ncbi:MAG: hypothetical protein ABI591_09230, partial [Kofleriaceae bacterium]
MNTDGQSVIATKHSIHGMRDFHASLTQLAVYVREHPEVRRGTFVARLPRMSAERVRQEWGKLKAVLRPELSRRLALVAVAPGDDVMLPDDAGTRNIAELVHRMLEGNTSERAQRRGASRWSRKSYEVWKVLLGAWLRREAALPLHEIQRRSGASYPTVSMLLDRLERIDELTRTSNRSAALTALPRRSLAEVLALGDGLRETHHFTDGSGRSPDAHDLARRIKAKGRDVAFGGVEAARYYTPDFNLNGLPRIDVTVGADADLSWVKSTDPALVETPQTSGGSALLVVHRLLRPEPAFIRATGATFADPAEVLLDLHELRLTEQADEFVQGVREK